MLYIRRKITAMHLSFLKYSHTINDSPPKIDSSGKMSHLESGFNPETKIWSGIKLKELYNSKVTLGEVIRLSLQRSPDKIGQICGNSGVALTNEEILLRSLKIACYLTRKFNFSHDDVAGIIVRNTENVAPLAFGLMYCGVAINALDTSFTEDEIINLFGSTKPKVVFCDADRYAVVVSALRTLKNTASIFIVSENVDQIPVTTVKKMLDEVSVKEAYEYRPNDPEDGKTHTALIVCSSGTTGSPKGVCIPHISLLGRQSLELFGKPATVLCFSTLHWMSGIGNLIWGTMQGMTRIITDEPFTPELMLRLIEQYNVSAVLTPPSQMALIVQSSDIKKRDLSSLKAYLCGGSAVSPILCDQFQKKVPNVHVIVLYGCTEVSGTAKMIHSPFKTGSVGKLAANIQMRIINDDDVALGPNERGEILLKSPYRFLGYYGRPEDTARAIDSDDWVHTGDIGYVDDDGFLYVVDRKKEIMKYKGYQVSPSELEIALSTLTGVSQVFVCGIPDPLCTDLPVALIVRVVDASICEEDVHNYMKAKLSEHKQLRGGVYFVDSLPMTPSGKVRRPHAKELAKRLYSGKD